MAYETGTQLKTYSESLLENGNSISSDNALLWINEFLYNKLREKAMIISTEDYTDSIYNTWYSLPADFEDVHRVDEYSNNGMASINWYDEYFEYEIRDDDIKFKKSGHYRLTYMVLPTKLTSLIGNIEIDSCFYQACALWMAYRALTNDDEDNAQSQTLGQLRLDEFNYSFHEAIKRRESKFKKKRKIRKRR